MDRIVTDQAILTVPSVDLNALEQEELFARLESIVSNNRNAAGLAAVQIGIHKRAFVVKYQGEIYRFSNSIIEEGKYPDWKVEGCLSIPNREFRVQRFNRIRVTDDINGTNREYRNVLAQIIQHEHDHTLGITLMQSGEEINKIV